LLDLVIAALVTTLPMVIVGGVPSSMLFASVNVAVMVTSSPFFTMASGWLSLRTTVGSVLSTVTLKPAEAELSFPAASVAVAVIT
jgi:hypothetical protein